ncbi:hypothetical protein [Streptococcus sp. sy010]|uniref:hypothetical protein n=1 Tax=Streptococcus sp. sy010 TaxID=2600148 RepID=UPI0016453ADC|nr:hypothetical protein [Streptococcus sp. sy010]
MKKVFNWLFAKPKKVERYEVVLPRQTWEENSQVYDRFHAYMKRKQTSAKV